MPLFKFLCKNCETQSELLVRGNSKPTCPACGSTDLVKHLGAFAPMKGSGPGKDNPAPCCATSCLRRQDGSCPLQ